MKENKYFLPTALAGLLGLSLLAAVLVRTFLPIVILPRLDIPNLVLVSLAALLLDHYLAPGAKRCWICIPVAGLLCFGVLPYAAAFVSLLEALKLGVFGCVIFTAVTALFTSMQDRLSSGPKAVLAPVLSALGIYLAVQAFAGILL